MQFNNSYYPTQQSYRPSLQQAYFAQGLKGRPVSSLEEARASAVDFDGSVFFFPDLANKRIYTKQINLDGTATLMMYELKDLPVENSNSIFANAEANYITREEFDKVIAELKKAVAAGPQPSTTPAPQPQAKQAIPQF